MANRGRPKELKNMFSVGKPTQFKDEHKSKGILDDFAQRKVLYSKEILGNTLSGTHYGDGSNLTGIAASGGSHWTSGSSLIWPSTTTLTISGANIDSSGYVSGTHYGDGSNLTGISASGGSHWISGATSLWPSTVTLEISGVNVTSGSNPGHTHTIDNITNPDASKTFNFGNNKSLTFSSVDNTPTAGEGTFNFEATGAYSGDLVHIHQHTGNPGDAILLALEATDGDVLPLYISGVHGTSIDANGLISGASSIMTGDVLGANITTISGTQTGISGVTISNLAQITTLSGAYLGLSGNVSDNLAQITTLSGAYLGLSGNVSDNLAQITTLSGAYLGLSGNVSDNLAQITTISGAHLGLSGNVTTHIADSTDPHGVSLTQTHAIFTSGTVTGDISGVNSGTAHLVGVIMSTSATPPTASGFAEGTIYLQHAA